MAVATQTMPRNARRPNREGVRGEAIPYTSAVGSDG